MNDDLIPFSTLVPGDRFTRIGAPHVVYSKTSHTWAHVAWKGVHHDTPLHWTTLVRRASVHQLNPGEREPNDKTTQLNDIHR